MKWEYQQLQAPIRGWLGGKLPEDLIPKLNELARQGWAIDQVICLEAGLSGTDSVVFILKRELR